MATSTARAHGAFDEPALLEALEAIVLDRIDEIGFGVGPCTNNYLVAERFRDCDELDEQLDYVFTFRMAPTPVRLRLLALSGSPRQYLAVRSR